MDGRPGGWVERVRVDLDVVLWVGSGVMKLVGGGELEEVKTFLYCASRLRELCVGDI